MKLHATLVEKLIKTYEVNSGWTEERKLRGVLENLDISVYTQTDGRQVLVSTRELNDHLRKFEQLEAQRKELEAQTRGN
jgi:BMFP domain-containing protein YqiC